MIEKILLKLHLKKPEADIEVTNLSQLLAKLFPDINEVLEED